MQSLIVPLPAHKHCDHNTRSLPGWAACVVLFFFLSLPALLPMPACAQQDEDQAQPAKTEAASQFKVSGTITSVHINEEQTAIRVRLGVNLVAENTGQQNLILLRRPPSPNTEYVYTSATAAEPLWVMPHPAPVSNGLPNHKQETRRSDIDQKEPPDDFTIVLSPGDTLGWDIPLELVFMKTAEPRNVQVGTAPRPVWDIVKKSCPCWLKLDLDLWPISIESKADTENPAFARKLAGRWKKTGALVYMEKRTEPIPLNLQ